MLWVHVAFYLDLVATPIYRSILEIGIHQNVVEFGSNSTNYWHSCPRIDSNLNRQYSEHEKRVLAQLRVNVSDILCKDYERQDKFLIPWLRDSDWDFVIARKKFLQAKEWRKTDKIDKILNETPIDPKSFGATRNPCVLEGVDNEGSPIVYLFLGAVVVRKLVLNRRANLYIRYWYRCLEETAVKIRTLAQTKGKEITQSLCIVDMTGTGVNIKQQGCAGCVGLHFDCFRTIQNSYPLMAKRLIVVEVPTVARPLIEVVKGIMSANNAKTVSVFGQDKTEWSAYLLQIIQPDQLPVFYGGTRANDQRFDAFHRNPIRVTVAGLEAKQVHNSIC